MSREHAFVSGHVALTGKGSHTTMHVTEPSKDNDINPLNSVLNYSGGNKTKGVKFHEIAFLNSAMQERNLAPA